MKNICEHWKDAGNLKSDFRDQIKGNHYCALDLTEHDTTIRNETLDDIKERIIYRQHEHKKLQNNVGFAEDSKILSMLESLRTSTSTQEKHP